MAAANTSSATSAGSQPPSAERGPEGLPAAAASPATAGASEESATTKVQKRYEALAAVRSRAIKGKGAWYWAYLEPMLLPDPATGLPSAVKLRCSLCRAAFSASNPSRTASEHLKRGTCPRFSNPRSSAAAGPGGDRAPVLIVPVSDQPSSPQHRHYQPQSSHRSRKRGLASSPPSPPPSHQISPLAVADPCRFSSPTATDEVPSSSSTPPPPPQLHGHLSHLVTSGGKEDLGALAMLEDSVKRLKNPKAPASPALSKTQVESAVALLSDWVHESCGAVSFSAVEHPKFRAFLHHVGLPSVSRRELAGARLDARYEEARLESEARIRDAPFFQMASDGWKPNGYPVVTEQGLVKLAVNLPDGSTVFRKAVFTNGKVPPKYAEEILRDTITSICGSGAVQRCAGIVADGFKATALRNLENQHNWMVNLPCQLRGLHGLVKDFAHDLPLFRAVAADCSKLTHFFNTNSNARSVFHKYQLQEHAHASLLRVAPSPSPPRSKFAPVLAMMEDVVGSGRALKMSVLDESYRAVLADDPVAREVGKMVLAEAFWNNLGAALALVKVIRTMAHDMETERPLVGQCLPMWEELRAKVKEWCTRFDVDPGPVESVLDRRFNKNYRPAWSAAFVLDPLYLTRDASGKYVPPFGRLTPEQEKDVDRVITRLLPRPEDARVALMELMKWRAEGLEPLYAQAVQVKQRDPATGKMRVANPASRRLVWETCLSDLRSLSKVAVRLIFLHATARGFRCNMSLLRWVHTHGRSRAAMDRAQKLVFVAAHARLERRDLSSEEEQDAALFADEKDDVLDEDTPELAMQESSVFYPWPWILLRAMVADLKLWGRFHARSWAERASTESKREKGRELSPVRTDAYKT
ncbi:hypothetical protein Taro_040656 [Colocasia esculenta]|uniref:DUF7963 domain-containing protein n=1 Tax=Colocasia esculenta TaxID=4460 RepID=A0A843WMI4_COLES|nr:hypothetical protein [Colocasia esculenta]